MAYKNMKKNKQHQQEIRRSKAGSKAARKKYRRDQRFTRTRKPSLQELEAQIASL